MNNRKPAALSWFTSTTISFMPIMAELMVIACVVRLIGLIEPFVFQTLIDRVLPFQREASLQLILILLVATTFFSAILGVLSTLMGACMANRLTAEFGRRIYDHVLNMAASHLQRFQAGAILTRLREIDTVRMFLTDSAMGLILDLVFAIVYLGALLALSPFLTMIVLIMLPLQKGWRIRFPAACIMAGRS
jgi:ATP-binding cassette, subfamily B, bacterial HlyB/CyaB